MEQVWQLLFFLLPAAAFLYASVGHGGASSYLMFLALFNFSQAEARPTALILNIVVSLLAFLSHRRTCEFPTRLFLSFAIFSIPAAFIGGSIEIDAEWYRRILGVLLVFPVLRFFNVFPQAKERSLPLRWWMPPVLALVIGFFSGLIGIGGGIILSPVLLMLGWASIRETAAISAL
ncbi:MAG TPA: sulfite exporter TauE/SafE family protein, partial [Opitutaceae bacterium]|nr:sulfite exporter TauE/SafE family protein [Opitutaceae bacterium]